MLKRLCLIILFILPGHIALAQDDARLAPLIKALNLPDVFEAMRDEGLSYGTDLDQQLLDGAGGAEWMATVGGIYEPDRIWQTFLPRFTAELAGQDIEAMTAFFDSERGQQITRLEIAARRAMLDQALEKQSRETYRTMLGKGDPRLTLLSDLIEANDLLEFNVMGAMNASYAFFNGLVDGKAFDYEITQEDILKDVWMQEPAIRQDTEEWMFAYLALAYAPLSDDDLEAYIEFSSSAAGLALNAALFAGYDEVSINVSKALGLSAARLMRGENL